MVLTQPLTYLTTTNQDNKFPYHYGSHATETCIRSQLTCTGFHTTMVLTQPQEGLKDFGLSLGFHTTMVLTQPSLRLP